MRDLLAQYSFQNFTQIESNQYHSNPDELFSLSIHELSHMFLARGTSFGAFNFIIEEGKKYCLENFKLQDMDKLNLISKRLIEASDITHECLSYYSQFAYLKSSNPEEFRERIIDLKKTDSYVAHKIHLIIDFLEDENWEVIFNSTVLFRTARLAMNIRSDLLFNENLLQEEYLVQSLLIKHGLDFNPNKRFIMLVNSLKKLLKSYPIGSITDEILLSEAGLYSIECSKETVLDFFAFMRKLFIKYCFPTEPVDTVINNTRNAKPTNMNDLNEPTEDDILEILDLIRPAVINTNYNYEFHLSFDEVQSIDGIISSFWIVIIGDMYQLIFDEIAKGTRYVIFADKNICKLSLAKYNLPIIIYSEDYEKLLIEFPEIDKRELFIYTEQPYLNSKEFIKAYSSEQRELMFYFLNNEIIVVFIKLKSNAIFTMFHTKYSIKLIYKDIKNKFFRYINTEGIIDDVFWKENRDWWKYEDIIKSLTQTTMFRIDPEIPPLGRRINLTDLL
ncbi:hypothetical protein DET54_101208 [Paenibacillus pabuli]|uniref:Uncharacterized protein n=1 Tax=Paenibacillus pabuli TaxID=1472 RepID=A0ABX9BSA9_9BACL|nr:hypothetical protein [Paenibacillus pabuli]RAJ03013.1 hypothetical protein DET54_101208 [Paenibacillus pabuli]